jgi:hypothetical protein
LILTNHRIDQKGDKEDAKAGEKGGPDVREKEDKTDQEYYGVFGHVSKVFRDKLHFLSIHLNEVNDLSLSKLFVGSTRDLQLLLVDQGYQGIRGLYTNHPLKEVEVL